jgi:hypothetical protein
MKKDSCGATNLPFAWKDAQMILLGLVQPAKGRSMDGLLGMEGISEEVMVISNGLKGVDVHVEQAAEELGLWGGVKLADTSLRG